nr:helix-turn-helix domain-containing protein [uncultured Acetobacterium sp.]
MFLSILPRYCLFGRFVKTFFSMIPFFFGSLCPKPSSPSLTATPKLLSLPILLRLQDYDLKNHTDYVHTLQVFLDNNLNAVQTAKDLFIHRATIIYRLEQIKEISETDLKNKNDLLHLHLSFELI